MAPRIGPLVGYWMSPNGTFAWPIGIIVMYLWLPMIPLGAGMVYIVGMAGCTRVLSRIAPPAPQGLTTPASGPQPIMVERVYLASDEAAQRGLPGPVIVERIHYQDPRTP